MTRAYFTDRDLGLEFPKILSEAGLMVHRHADHFAHDCPDEEWLSAIGSRGWVALTHDGRIRYKPNQLRALTDHRVALLVIVGRVPFPNLARAFVLSLSSVEKFLGRHEPPFVGKVYQPSPTDMARKLRPRGRVELWYPRPPGSTFYG